MRAHQMQSVDGQILFDLDPDVAGPGAATVELGERIDVEAMARRARALTYTCAAFELRLGGAAATVRPRLLDTPDETLARYRDEIRPLVDEGRFVDLGALELGGLGLDAEATGWGVAAAAAAWVGPLEGRTVAVAGLGTVGDAVVRAVRRRGGRVVAVSTGQGAVARASGFDVDELADARAEHGDSFVHHLGLDVHRPLEVHELRVDVLVAGGADGELDGTIAERVQTQVVVPATAAPWTADGLAALRRHRVAALPAFVAAGGGVVASQAPPGLTPEEVQRRVEREIHDRIESARLAKMDPVRHATTLADTFLTTWVPAAERPDGPAVAA